MKISGLYFITDSKLSKQGIMSDVQQVIEAGCAIVQYREKEKETGEIIAEAKQIAALCKEKNVLFLINDRIDIALAVEADGVHLGQEDMPCAIARKLLGKNKILGLTVHSVAEAVQAEKQGVDYVSVSPIFATETKPDAGKPVGIELIKEIKRAVKVPVVAIGGINEQNLRQVLEAGADAVAIISAIVCNENPGKAAKRIVKAISEFE
jgi:thiamine-phosphate pyrophosphorylase